MNSKLHLSINEMQRMHEHVHSTCRARMLTRQQATQCRRWHFVRSIFPRVRTPCGHGAQVIVEGREEQSDGGEKNKDNQNKQTTAHRPSLHHLAVFPLCQVKRRLVTINGPEFSKEGMAAQVCAPAKSQKKASNGLHFLITSDQRPHYSVAEPWSQCRSGVSQCSNASCFHVMESGGMLHALEKTFLVVQPMQLIALTSPEACYQPVIKQWRS